MCKQESEELRIPNVREPGACLEESLSHCIPKDIKAWVSQDCRFVFLSEVLKLVWVIPGSDGAALQGLGPLPYNCFSSKRR